MIAWLLTISGAVFVAYGGRAVAGAPEPSWPGALILPGGLLVLGLGALGLLIPGFLPDSLW